MEDPRSFQIPRGIKEKLFITISFFFFNFYSKTSKRADTCLPQLGSFLLGFQSIPTAIKRCSYFKPYLPLWRYVIIRIFQCALLQRALLILVLQMHSNGVSMAVLVSICAGPHPMQPDRASKDSLGSLVFAGNDIAV